MMIEVKFFCPHCGTKLLVDEPVFGLEINCPQCGKAIIAPVGRLTGEPPLPTQEAKSSPTGMGLLAQREEELNSVIRGREQRLQGLEKQVADFQATLAATEIVFSEKRSQLKQLTDDVEAKKQESARSEAELNSFKARTLDELRAVQDKEKRLKELDVGIAERASQCKELDHRIDAVNRSIAEANARLNDIRDAESEAVSRLRSAEYRYYLTYIKPHLPPSLRSAATEHEEQLSRAALEQKSNDDHALHTDTKRHASNVEKDVEVGTDVEPSNQSLPSSKCEEVESSRQKRAIPLSARFTSLFKPLACPHCGASLNNFIGATTCPGCHKDLKASSHPASPVVTPPVLPPLPTTPSAKPNPPTSTPSAALSSQSPGIISPTPDPPPPQRQAEFYPIFWLGLLLGVFGVHRFYVRKIGTGLLQLVTFGGMGIWWLVDMIMILFGKFRDKGGTVIPNIAPKLSWSVFAVVVVIGLASRGGSSPDTSSSSSGSGTTHMSARQLITAYAETLHGRNIDVEIIGGYSGGASEVHVRKEITSGIYAGGLDRWSYVVAVDEAGQRITSWELFDRN